MKAKPHIPDDPTLEDMEQITAALPHNADITSGMVEDAVYQFLKHRSPIMLRALSRHLRNHFTGCILRIEYPSSKGRNVLITIKFNKKLAKKLVVTTDLTLRVSWRVEPMYSRRFVPVRITDYEAYAKLYSLGHL